jgi:hypothetical protein
MDMQGQKIDRKEYNVYCDESCHLEHDKQDVMLLGAVWCPTLKVKQLAKKIRELKAKFKARGELKWTKVSKSKQKFYINLVNYFLKEPDLHFRCLVIKDKKRLNHSFFNQGSHDTFYYKMYFSMLKAILSPQNLYNIYLDIKDTRSNHKVQELGKILCNNYYDFTRQMIAKIQHIRSDESELLQLADFFIGAVAYKNRNMEKNQAKVEVIRVLEQKLRWPLNRSTSLFNDKFNLFIFLPSEVEL